MLSEKQVSKEQIEQARKLDLLSYLQQYEPHELVKVASGVYSTRSNDSLKISNGKWYRWSRGYGGVSALDYLIKVREMDFVSAVRYLCDKAGYTPLPPVYTAKPPQKKPLELPPANDNNDRVVAYLTARGIDPRLIQSCIHTKRLYEDKRHNCVFVGFDHMGRSRFGFLRSSDFKSTFMREADGSDKRYSFSLPPPENISKLHIFESAIDLLSYVTLKKMHTDKWEKAHYLALSGVYQPKKELNDSLLPLALGQYLHEHPEIEQIDLRLDHDRAGELAAQAICHLLQHRCDMRYLPPAYGKDYNEMLMKEKGIGADIRTRNSKNVQRRKDHDENLYER